MTVNGVRAAKVHFDKMNPWGNEASTVLQQTLS
jgi:hypothetical protein